ncbi:complement factor H-like isoform X3 [Silurus meridionalis]|uniref:complement factor H-like isoform X3 n=1 Tax=Silurus meridionalis TaxID=175797 RepID=UPI001EEC60EB|nr:complement factor H-like isoform X3 [Silurus meridionalis]
MGSTMQEVSKIFFVAFWVFSFTLVKSQECSTGTIQYENVQKSDLLKTYQNGATVKVNCATGYIGSYKLQCENGNWETISARECKKKPCGHPGDTPNGDFKLTVGSEFVFGARVKYTCRPGYNMASRIDYRDCRIQGWDNAVPVCEVVKCSPITNSDDVIASGNIEEPSFGDVIHFECASFNKMLDAPEDIHCLENGQWSGKVPKCKDIECVAPEIPHGITNPAIKYRENDIIQYKCEEKYQPRPGKPKCTKYGWSIKPECEEIVCMLGSPTVGVYSTEPKGVSVFHVGEHVQITCLKTHWFYGTKQQSRSVKCQNDGTWSSRPVCEEMTCEKPEEEHLVLSYYYRYKQTYQLNADIQYTCEAGYKGGPSSRCTENGWDPKPGCIKITCSKPHIDYGTVKNPQNIYRADTHVVIQCDDGYEFYATCTRNGVWQSTGKCKAKPSVCAPFSLTHGFTRKSDRGYLYTCDSDYKTFDGKWWGEVTCQGGQWSDTPQCIPDKKCGKIPTVYKVINQGNRAFEDRERHEFECEVGPCCFHCANGKWQNQDCAYQKCPTPPYVENAVITSHEARTSQQSVTYECRENYSITGQQKINCIDSKWGNAPTCTLNGPKECLNPDQEINNAHLDEAISKAQYLDSRQAKYKCKDGFQFKDRSYATCSAGQWNYPQCIPVTNFQGCPRPENNINNATWSRANRKAYYKEGDTTEYRCNEGFHFEAQSFAKCSAGKWTYPQCIEVTNFQGCPLPENNINNATWSRANRKAYYTEGDTTEYRCNEGFRFEAQSFAKCSAGKWTYPQCIEDS